MFQDLAIIYGETATTLHHWNGQSMVLETTGSGLVKSRFLRGIGLLAQQIDGELHWYLHNAHGDVVGQTDSNLTLLSDYETDAFGVEKAPNPLDPNPFRFCGEYYDAWSGTIYLRNRIYDPKSGRFLSEDPIKSGANWYSYCGGNPVAFIDPLGLQSTSPSGNDLAYWLLFNDWSLTPPDDYYEWGEYDPSYSYHQGVDFSRKAGPNESGVNVHSISNGTVVYANNSKAYESRPGTYSLLVVRTTDEEGEEIYLKYVHLDISETIRNAVQKAGDEYPLSVRDIIGTQALLGQGSGEHTHIETIRTYSYEKGIAVPGSNPPTTRDPSLAFENWGRVGPPNRNNIPLTGRPTNNGGRNKPSSSRGPSLDDIAMSVIRGNYGNGQDRIDRLTNAGYNYRQVQDRVNQLMR